MKLDTGNIILHQVSDDIKEIQPILVDSSIRKALTLDEKKLEWFPLNEYKFKGGNGINVYNDNGVIKIDASIDTRVIINNRLKGTNIHYLNERLGIGRDPLFSYKFDILVPKNTLMTAFHIGDGEYGFSMGNGTNDGFIPEIIGMGSDENDTGLYFIGRAGNNKPSTIPLIIIDGRNNLHQKVTNRPIFGITNAEYGNYKLIVDHNGLVGIGKSPEIYKLEVNGTIRAKEFLLDSSISMNEIAEIIIEQKEEIDLLKDKITKLEDLLK